MGNRFFLNKRGVDKAYRKGRLFVCFGGALSVPTRRVSGNGRSWELFLPNAHQLGLTSISRNRRELACANSRESL